MGRQIPDTAAIERGRILSDLVREILEVKIRKKLRNIV